MYVGKNEMKNIKLAAVLAFCKLFPEAVYHCCGDSKVVTLEFDEGVKKPT
ncbi:TPA: hypothetical protein ACS7XE_002043 [Providencia alcalifaciens]|nr:hypothetical protein LDO51_17475 [Providencia alcalifaciens]